MKSKETNAKQCKSMKVSFTAWKWTGIQVGTRFPNEAMDSRLSGAPLTTSTGPTSTPVKITRGPLHQSITAVDDMRYHWCDRRNAGIRLVDHGATAAVQSFGWSPMVRLLQCKVLAGRPWCDRRSARFRLGDHENYIKKEFS